MPFDIANAGGTLATGAATGAVENILDIATSGIRRKQQLKTQKASLEQQNEASMDIWKKTNYGPQMEQMKSAGLNTALMYGMGSGGGGSTGTAGGQTPEAQSQYHGMDIMGATQVALMKAQADKLAAETAEIEARKNLQQGQLGRIDYEIPQIKAGTEKLKGETGLIGAQKVNQEIANSMDQLNYEIAKDSEWYTRGNLMTQWQTNNENYRKAAAEANISAATQETVIAQKQADLIATGWEIQAKKMGIEVDKAQIAKWARELVQKDNEINISQQLSNVQGGRLRLDQYIHDLPDTWKAGIDAFGQIAEGTLRNFKRGGPVGNTKQVKPTLAPKGTYNKWGTKTSKGGYDLK